MRDAKVNFNTKNGSAILIVVLIMSVLSFCCLTFWQNSSLFNDISLKRVEYEQKYRLAECGLEYAVAVCSNNFDALVDGENVGGESQEVVAVNDHFEIETDFFKFSENIGYKCKIYIDKDGSKALKMRSVILDSAGQRVFEISCSLHEFQKKGPNNKNIKSFEIKNWQICDK